MDKDGVYLIAFSILSALFIVLAPLCLAYPKSRAAKSGIPWSKTSQFLAYTLNIILQVISNGFGVLASWYGPVTLVLPYRLAAQIAINLIVFEWIMKLEESTLGKTVGTIMIVIATMTLPTVGPEEQDDLNMVIEIEDVLSLIWTAFLILGMLVSLAWLLLRQFRLRKPPPTIERHSPLLSKRNTFIILLVVQVTSNVLDPTSSKIMLDIAGNKKLLTGDIVFYTLITIASIYAVFVQSTSVNQSIFVPAMGAATVILNNLTGIIIWNDYRTVKSWSGYFLVLVMLLFGNLIMGLVSNGKGSCKILAYDDECNEADHIETSGDVGDLNTELLAEYNDDQRRADTESIPKLFEGEST